VALAAPLEHQVVADLLGGRFVERAVRRLAQARMIAAGSASMPSCMTAAFLPGPPSCACACTAPFPGTPP